MSEKILIVDDDLDTLRLIGVMLQRQGMKFPLPIAVNWPFRWPGKKNRT